MQKDFNELKVQKNKLHFTDFKETRIFSTDFGKNTQNRKVLKIRFVGCAMFHANGRNDGWTDGQV